MCSSERTLDDCSWGGLVVSVRDLNIHFICVSDIISNVHSDSMVL